MIQEIERIEYEYEVKIEFIGWMVQDIEHIDLFTIHDKKINKTYSVKQIHKLELEIISQRLEYNLYKNIILD